MIPPRDSDEPPPRPIRAIVCEGSARAMGSAQGEALRPLIHAARRDLERLEAFRLQQPAWLPIYPAYRWLAERKAGRYLARAGASGKSGLTERLAGIAEGAGAGVRTIALFNAMEPLLSAVEGCTACPGACSAAAVRGRRSGAGEPIIAKNFDYLEMVQPYQILRESRPRGGYRSLEFTTAPLVGAVDGMNEAGLCITYNYAFAIDVPAGPAPSISMVIGEALARFATVPEASAWIASAPRWGAGLLMLADASGDIASLELSNTRSHLRRPGEGEDVLSHTNAYFGAETRAVQPPADSVYTDRAPAALRGERLHESSERRDERFPALLNRHERIGTEELAAIMADHGPDGTPDDRSLCVHGDYWNTTACLQFLPRSRRVRVAFDHACRARYTDFSL